MIKATVVFTIKHVTSEYLNSNVFSVIAFLLFLCDAMAYIKIMPSSTTASIHNRGIYIVYTTHHKLLFLKRYQIFVFRNVYSYKM